MNAELNAKVAEKVFGWDVQVGTVARGGKWVAYNSTPKEEIPSWIPVPDFSGDIAAAWQVVERLECGDTPLFLHLLRYGPDFWLADFMNATPITKGIGKGSASEAICLAALAALEGKS